MKTHQEHLQEILAQDPSFARELAEAGAELRLAMALAERREALGLTQAAVAEAMAISQPHVARYEKAGRTPLVTTLWRFCDALHATITFGPQYAVQVHAADPVIGARHEASAGTETAAAAIRMGILAQEDQLLRGSIERAMTAGTARPTAAPAAQDLALAA